VIVCGKGVDTARVCACVCELRDQCELSVTLAWQMYDRRTRCHTAVQRLAALCATKRAAVVQWDGQACKLTGTTNRPLLAVWQITGHNTQLATTPLTTDTTPKAAHG
jgi:hypothetical protein